MSQTLADRFKESGGKPIRDEGRILHWTYQFSVVDGDRLVLRFLNAVQRPVQGVGLQSEGSQMEVAGTLARSIALWYDTAPEVVTIDVVRARRRAVITIGNQWRDEKYGMTMYRLNDAAMEIMQQEDGATVFRCSDGWGDPDFCDLVFEVRRESP